jgi:uncharacterized protein YbjQ (UPF0145 family)
MMPFMSESSPAKLPVTTALGLTGMTEIVAYGTAVVVRPAE